MSHTAHTQILSGQLLDLNNPDPNLIDLEEAVPKALSHIARFTGQTAHAYSVAQHCVLGASAIYEETHDHALALHFLLHDAHEAFIGDITHPTQNALAYAMACEQALSKSPNPEFIQTNIVDVKAGFRHLKRKLDQAIYLRLGAAMPSPMEADQIADMDVRMLRWERDNILKNSARGQWRKEIEEAKPITCFGSYKSQIWSAQQAYNEWRDAYKKIIHHALDSQRFE